MKQFVIFIVSVFCVFQILVAQGEVDSEAIPDVNHIFRVDLLAPGIGGEVAFGRIGSFEGSANLGFVAGAVVSGDEREGYFFIGPEAHAQLRAYFNRQKRIDKGKSIKNNSGLFAGGHVGYTGPDIYRANDNYELGHSIVAGPIFGVQRTFDCNLQIGFSLGLGVRWDEFHGVNVGGPGNLNFSYVILPKRQKKVIELD